MIGAIIGDIVGSRYERKNIKTKQFRLFTNKNRPTDDTVMTLAVGLAILDCDYDYINLPQYAVRRMREFGNKYPDAGYGGKFRKWLIDENPHPYNSFGNGAAMRVSACGFAARSYYEAVTLARAVTEVTHNHPEGLKGAEATAAAIYLARTGKTIDEIRQFIDKNYYHITFMLGDIRESYRFDVSCEGSVPQALEAFFESNSFEDAIRNAVSIGGDSDTIAAITGGIAQAYYGVPTELADRAMSYLDEDQKGLVREFNKIFGINYIKSETVTSKDNKDKNEVKEIIEVKKVKEVIDAKEVVNEVPMDAVALKEYFKSFPDLARPLQKRSVELLKTMEEKLSTMPSFIQLVKSTVPEKTLQAVFTSEQREMLKAGAVKLMAKKDGTITGILVDTKTGQTVSQVELKDLLTSPDLVQSMTNFAMQMQNKSITGNCSKI